MEMIALQPQGLLEASINAGNSVVVFMIYMIITTEFGVRLPFVTLQHVKLEEYIDVKKEALYGCDAGDISTKQ